MDNNQQKIEFIEDIETKKLVKHLYTCIQKQLRTIMMLHKIIYKQKKELKKYEQR